MSGGAARARARMAGVPAYAESLERTLGPGALPAFLAEVEASASATLPLARSLFGSWLEHAVGVPRRALG